VREDGFIAADLHTYIDDNRVTANDADEAWSALSRIAKVCAYLHSRIPCVHFKDVFGNGSVP
jgi:hypothetical protein